MEDGYYNKLMTGQSAAMPKPANAFDSLGEAVTSLREVQKMARMLADRLTGGVPENASAQKLQEVGGGGLFDGVERQAVAIREIHADIYASLSRIENRL